MRRFLMFSALALLLAASAFTLTHAPEALAWLPGDRIVPECSFGDGQGPYCQGCDFIKLINNIVGFSVFLSSVIATLMFAYAGFLYVTAAANPNNIQAAKDVFGKVFLGFVFILTAWLIVDIVLTVFTPKGGLGFWSDVQCAEFGDSIATTQDKKTNPISDFSSRTVQPADDQRTALQKLDAEQQAREEYAESGIDVNKSSCALNTSFQDTRSNPNGCTDVSLMQPTTEDYVKEVKSECGTDCEVVITGGSEKGHAGNGRGTHSGGDKVDLRPTSGVNDYVEKNLEKVSSGVYKDPKTGAVWVREDAGKSNDHWDICVPDPNFGVVCSVPGS